MGKSAPTVMKHESKDIRCVVHGDDFTFIGPEDELKDIAKKMGEWYSIKMRGIIGPERHDLKKIDILNRTVEWDIERGIVYRADRKHVQIIAKDMGIEMSSNGVDVPGAKAEAEDPENDVALVGAEATKFRAIAARANYLALDRPDIQFSTKEICRSMSAPKQSDWVKLKRLARYLVKHPEIELVFDGFGLYDRIVVYVDADWAGCKKTRKSTSGGMVTLASTCLKTWSSTQGTVALSSGESELYAVVKGAAEGIGMQSLMMDLGWQVSLVLRTDSSAAKAISWRRGIGKVRHLDVRYLWVQQRLNDKLMHIGKVKGAVNPANILTKYCNASEVAENCKFIGVHFGENANLNVLLFNLCSFRKHEFQATRTRTRWPPGMAVVQRSAKETPQDCADVAKPNRVRWADMLSADGEDDEIDGE